MTDDAISIKIADRVAPSIVTKLKAIEAAAKSAHDPIARLNKAIAGLQTGGLTQIVAASSRAQQALNQAAVSAQRLATEQQRTAAAGSAASAAQQRVATAAAQAGAAQANLATATARTHTEQQRGAQAAQRVATEQARTATASAQAAAAADRAALAALRLAQAQNRVGQASQRSAAGVMSFVRSAAALAGLGLGAGAIVGAADAYTVLQNKLQNVSESMAQNNRLTSEIFTLANKARVPVQELATAFARFDAALQQSGASQKESLRITETVTKALKVGGATAGETGSALLQLSQAFNKGKLNGDEFRSLMENMPVFVKKAIAAAAKVPLSGIFDAAASGKITIDTLREAFGKLGDTVDAKFAKTIPTVSESFVVLKNNLVQAFGEMNKALGITSGLSRLIIGLSNNLGILGVAVVAIGSSLLLYFGPNLAAMLGRAAVAMRLFTAAMMANPIGLIAVALTTAIAALAIFSDKIAITADGAVTLKDAFLTAWAYIKDAFTVVAGTIEQVWINTSLALTGSFDGIGAKIGFVFGAVLAIIKAVYNSIIAAGVSAVKIIIAAWNNFPAAMESLFVAVVNIGATAIETIVNSWQVGLRLISSGLAEVAPETAEKLNGALDKMTLKLPRMKGSKAAQDFTGEVAGIVKDAFSTDYVGNAADAFMNRARKIAAGRRKKEAELRGEGNGEPPGGGGGSKEAIKRAQALMLVNKQLDDELARMFMLKPEREIQQKFDAIEADLLRKKITLSAQEASAIKDKIANIEKQKFVQQEFDRIYEASIEPARTKNAVLEASNKLLAMGAISQEKYNAEMLRANDVYKESTQAFFSVNKELDEQINLLKMLPAEREVEQQVMQAVNAAIAAGKPIREDELKALREKLYVVQQLNIQSQIQAQMMANSAAQQSTNMKDDTNAALGLMNNPAANFSALDVVAQLAANNEALQGTQEFAQSQLQIYKDMYAQIEMLRQADVISDSSAAMAKFDIWQRQSAATFGAVSGMLGNLAQLRNSDNKKAAALGKKAAIAQALINTYEGATAAFKSAANIPYVGWILAPVAAAAAIAGGMAQVNAIRSQGFKQGGYTGDFGVNQAVGPVHGKEFVMDAPATARIGKADLEALRTGAASVQRNSESAGKAAPARAAAGATGGTAAPVVVPAPAIRLITVESMDQARNFANTDENEQVIINVLQKNGLLN